MVLVAVFLGTAFTHAAEPPCAWLGADVDAGLAPDVAHLNASPTRHRQLPLFRELMQQPLNAPCRASGLLDDARRLIDSPLGLFRWAAGMGGIDTQPRSGSFAEAGTAPENADPLATGLAWMKPAAAATGIAWPPPLPDHAGLPEPLRTEIGRTLAAMGNAHRLLERALVQLPATVTPQMLRDQLVQNGPAPDHALDLRALLPLLDRDALVAGMLELVAAAQRLYRFVTTTPALPRIAWQMDTPLGAIVVDTTGRNSVYRLEAPLLLLDAGGDDLYEFVAAPAARHISVVLDHGGNDRYVAHAAGADPSAATLGYGILWDTDGDDVYEGTDFAQAAALFGAVLLVDGAGTNRFLASGHAQGYALGGIALLVSGPGNDEFVAQTHAQASAGPEAVSVLIDRAGDDRYTLENSPLSRPSPQLPTHNTSMGQGAGRGLRPATAEGVSAAGGIGMLIDLEGNDRYTAQVFAQGAGFHEGLGLLIDGGGADHFDAAWYAMGAAAHSAAGVLLKRGSGNDRYRATHSTSLGAAHDFSVAVFLDEGGDDHYMLNDLGLGASHDHGVAVFADFSGSDRYEVGAAACRAFGFAQSSEPETSPADPPARALFIDRDRAADYISATCQYARDGSTRTAPAAFAR